MLLFSYIGRKLAHFLAKPHDTEELFPTSNPALLQRTLRKGDILLVEGTSHFSTSIKYLSQSTWSHAALYIGDHLSSQEDLDAGIEPLSLLEADIECGVRVIPLSTYAPLHSRICRPIGLSENEINQVIQFAVSRIGDNYDLKNIFDLARYLVPTPPIPSKWRRKALTLGSGDPTRAICSSLIAQAFQSIKYPILPDIIYENPEDAERISHYQRMHRRRDPSLFTPRDFDVSPYFEVIKPMVQSGFDHHAINWVEPHPAEEAISNEPVPVAEPVGNMANTEASLQEQADMETSAIRVDMSADKTPG
ncbi:YiiX/YebB-like N1pC/P60 family cysteine hydrolase [Aliamphritea ceti]|uniref:YiiX/YebB-like N1pC/P60 family cysteine hydrolase n=1 Tax=Aliamphritea ceti TaxID=1524258 RepID=UPI0021C34DCA|nr:YiiX/YebB-like N1pC/P60 family cysteine hydrolase [Aliamphritea ceti]